MPVSRDVAHLGMQLLLGMEPDDESVELHRMGYETLEGLRTAFMRTPQAKALFAEANQAGDARKSYSIPPFLLRPPVSPKVPWRFEPPSLTSPVSQLCTAEQMAGPDYHDLCIELGMEDRTPHRKIWEFAYILSALQSRSLLKPGMRGLGFGTGQEPLPSVFARAGVQVTATDAPADLDFTDAWAQSSQWAKDILALWREELVDRDVFLEHVSFRTVDMNDISPDLRGYDFCWSACCFEHLGSIQKGLDFLVKSLDTLKPGGVSVQTSEFNLVSNTETLESSGLVLFRKSDFEAVIEKLIDEGHKVEPLNLWPGATLLDEHIDLPPFSLPHLKLELAGMATTSIGLIITKAD